MTHAQIKETADKIVALLDGFSYKEANEILLSVSDKVRFDFLTTSQELDFFDEEVSEIRVVSNQLEIVRL